MRIKIDGEILRVVETDDGGSYGLPSIEIDDGRKYIVCEDDTARKHVENMWLDMAERDPTEFVSIIGEERLIKWALGHSDEFGISSLKEFAERSAEYYEAELAEYDGSVCTVNKIGKLAKLLGVPISHDLVALRTE